MKKTILVFGTTYNQVPLIKTAREMGLHTISIGLGGGICQKYANEIFPIDFTDIDAVLKIARGRNIIGMVTCGTSNAIHAIARCNEILQISDKIISEEVARNAVFKDRYRAIIGNLVPNGFVASDAAQAAVAAACLRNAIVVKPADGGGGKGISILNTHAEGTLEDAMLYARQCSKMNSVVVEEFIEGQVIGVESFVFDGYIHTLVIPEKITDNKRPNVTKGVIFPSIFPSNVIERIQEANEKAIEAMGIKWGPVHIDMVVDSAGQPFIIDIGPRLAGGPLMAEMVPAYYQYNFYRATIQLSMGQIPDNFEAVTNNKYYASNSILPDKNGILTSVSYNEEDVKNHNILNVMHLIECGSSVKDVQNDGDRIVLFTSEGTSYEEVRKNVEHFAECIAVNIM